MLIRNAEIYGAGSGPGCVRIHAGHVTETGALSARPGEQVIDAAGGAVLPGLHDHHLHLMSLAAAAESVRCGPPDVNDSATLVAVLQQFQQANERSWLRGVGYHERVAGDIDRAWLDRHAGGAPVRIQHRSGRLWIVNSPALALIEAAQQRLPPSQRPAIASDGRLYDLDPVLHLLSAAATPAVDAVSQELAGFGVTGCTDMTPGNAGRAVSAFRAMQGEGRLLQNVRLAGKLELLQSASSEQTTEGGTATLDIGATKVHLHEAHLPDFDALCATITASHLQQREVAVHCVTQVELVFTLAAFRAASVMPGDRIEHASVTPPELLDQIKELDLTVCTQPNFVGERGDAYLADIDPAAHGWLYRCQSFLAHGVTLAGGTDAPFGHCDPWRAMAAAVSRRTPSNGVLGEHEALNPEQALALFLGELHSPGTPRRIEVGAMADLCVLDQPWSQVRDKLSSHHVRATLRGGELIFDRVDEAPG